MAAVVADAEIGADHVCHAFLADGDGAQCVDGLRVNGADRRVLADYFLQQILTLGGKPLPHSFRAFFPIHIDLFDALAASTVYRLCHKRRMPGHKIQCGLFFRQIEPLPANKFMEASVEFSLVPQKMSERWIIILLNERVIAATGDIGIPLLRGQIVHFKQVIIHIARAVIDRTPLHIPQDPQPGTAGFFMDRIDLLQHCLVIHVKQAAHNIS